MTKLYTALIIAGLSFLFIIMIGRGLQSWGKASIESYQEKQREQMQQILEF
jgi:hypothetical protein